MWADRVCECVYVCPLSFLLPPLPVPPLLSLLSLSPFLLCFPPPFSSIQRYSEMLYKMSLGKQQHLTFSEGAKKVWGLVRSLLPDPAHLATRNLPFPSCCSQRPSLYPDLSASPASIQPSCFTPLLLQYVTHHLYSSSQFLVSPLGQVFIYCVRTETVLFLSPYSLRQMHSL